MNKRKILSLVLIMVSVCCAMAQDLASMMRPSVAVSFDVSPHVNTTLNTADGDRLARGRIEDMTTTRISANMGLLYKRLGREKKDMILMSAVPFYEHSTMSLADELNVEGYELNMPSRHHSYGMNLMALYRSSIGTKPLIFMAMPFVEFSQYGYERIGAIAYGTLILKGTQRTQIGVSAVLLVGTALSWPLFAGVTFSHKFNDEWSINIKGAQNSVSYRPRTDITLKAITDVKSTRYFIHPVGENLPHEAVWRQISFKTGLQCDYDLSKHFTLTAFAGSLLPINGKVCSNNGSTVYARLRTNPIPSFSLSMRCKL